MLSYMLPVEEKTHTTHNLKLNLNNINNVDVNNHPSSNNAGQNGVSTTSTKIIHFEQQQTTSVLKNSTEIQRPKSLVKSNNSNNSIDRQESTKQFINMETVNEDGSGGGSSSILSTSTGATSDDGKKVKLTKIGTNKNAALKRVSFGSSKGSMVETLVFETPTPLPEHAERQFGFPSDQTQTGASSSSTTAANVVGKTSTTSNNLCNSSSSCLDDSGIELQEELERSKVRVTFFQSDQPQQISPPEPQFFDFFDVEPNLLTKDEMDAQTALPANYNRQISTESGWDNPFRPGGDLSREADEIVNMIKGGKPITPNDTLDGLANGNAQQNGHSKEVNESVTKTEASQNLQSPAKGKSPDKKNGDANTQISNSVVPGPQSASHVVVEEKKKKKCTCCVIQ